MSKRELDALEKTLDRALKKQVQDGLSTVFDELSCKAVAREIKKGKNVTGNAEFGFRMCVHDKVGPRYDPTKKKFHPMTASSKRLEEKSEKLINAMLKTGGFKEMSPDLIPRLRKGDREFELKIKKRR